MSFQPNLWGVMRRASGNAVALRNLIAPATGEQLIRLHRRFLEAVTQLEGGLAYDGHSRPAEAARWVVMQGRPAWERARHDLHGVPREIPADVPDFGEVIARAYRERFGVEIPDQEPDPVDDPSIGYDASWEDRLWELTDVTHVGVPLAESLEGHTRSELLRLAYAIQRVHHRVRAQLAAALGDDEGTDWSTVIDWIIGEGKVETEHYVAHPEEILRAVPLDAVIFSHALDALYEQRYGTALPWPE